VKQFFDLPLAVFAIACVLAGPASATLVTNGYMSDVTYRDCSITTCDSFNRPFTGSTIDFSQMRTTEVTLTNGLGISGSALTTLTGDVLAPELKTKIDTSNTIAGESVWMSSQALSTQRYVNTGSDSIQIALNIATDWTVSDGLTPVGGLPNGMAYQVSIFETNNGLVDLDLTGSQLTLFQLTNMANGLVGTVLWRDADNVSTTGAGNVFSPTLTLDPGSGFFVAIRWGVGGGFGAAVNGFDTLQTTFTDANHVALDASSTLKPVGVPEPGSLSLLGAGLFGLGIMRRRRAAT
jgi:hypothetical protein